MKIRLNLVALALVCLTLSLAAQTTNDTATSATGTVPRLITFSGTLSPAATEAGENGVVVTPGTAPTHVIAITFSLYSEQTGGAPLWSEVQNVHVDGSGRYTVQLGASKPDGLPLDVFASAQAQWLGVQVQGEPEQPRIMLVSVPYAFKAHEAETLGGKTASDFMPAANVSSSATQGRTSTQPTSASLGTTSGQKGAQNAPPQSGPTNFSGSNTTQIVGVTQTGTGAGLVSSAPSKAILGSATAATGTAYAVEGTASGTGAIAIFGNATATTGSTYGIKGSSASTTGVGVKGQNTSTTGHTIGVQASVASADGTVAVFNNTAGGKLISGQNNEVEKFAVDGNGNVTAAGFTGSGTLTANSGVTAFATTGSAVVGTSSGTSGEAGVVGLNDATSGLAYGVIGSTSSTSGTGVWGTSTNGTGVLGTSTNFAGVLGQSNTGDGVYGETSSSSGIAVYGNNQATSGAAYGVEGYSGSNSTSAIGVYGKVSNGSGVRGQSGNGPGVSGTGFYGGSFSANATSGGAVGVYGQSGDPAGYGVYGTNASTSNGAVGVYGQASSGMGVYGASSNGNGAGVYGANTATSGYAYGVAGYTSSTQTNSAGVYGQSGAGNGVYGNSTSGAGVYGQSSTGAGVSGSGTYGVVGGGTASVGAGVYGQAINVNGVEGVSTSAAGLHGESTSGPGVYGTTTSSNSAGVYAINTNTSNNAGPGLYAQNSSNDPSSAAGYFVSTGTPGYILKGVNGINNVVFSVDTAGDLTVAGTLSKGGGSFKIDDPLDPANKTLSHSFVESPDMMNIYNGIVRLDARGEAWVELPQYFEALNRDFRYQLTSIGAPQPRLYIACEVKGNRFKIAGGKANAKVSWQVTGIRQDAWANAHRIPNEEDKPLEKHGTYLHPELFGAAADKQTNAMLQR